MACVPTAVTNGAQVLLNKYEYLCYSSSEHLHKQTICILVTTVTFAWPNINPNAVCTLQFY